MVMKNPRIIDMAGKKFGSLTALRATGTASSGDKKWQFQCDCGSLVVATGYAARSGRRIACAACTRKLKPSKRIKHGMTESVEFKTWTGILTRCLNPNSASYNDYGGRGIKVCDRWRSSFKSFLEDVGPRPSEQHSIDRINNDKGYAPDNCRWATHNEQARNKRNTVLVDVDGEMKPLSQISEELGVSISAMRYRVSKGLKGRGVINSPVAKYTLNGITDTTSGWSKRTGIKQSTISMRLSTYGWSVEKALTKGASL